MLLSDTLYLGTCSSLSSTQHSLINLQIEQTQWIKLLTVSRQIIINQLSCVSCSLQEPISRKSFVSIFYTFILTSLDTYLPMYVESNTYLGTVTVLTYPYSLLLVPYVLLAFLLHHSQPQQTEPLTMTINNIVRTRQPIVGSESLLFG